MNQYDVPVTEPSETEPTETEPSVTEPTTEPTTGEGSKSLIIGLSFIALALAGGGLSIIRRRKHREE